MQDRSRRAGGRPTAPAATSSGAAAAATDDDAGVAPEKGRVAAVGGPGGVRAGGVRGGSGGGDELALLPLLEPLEVGLRSFGIWGMVTIRCVFWLVRKGGSFRSQTVPHMPCTSPLYAHI